MSSHFIPADELSMHLLTTPVLYRVLTFKSDPQYCRMVGVILGILFTITMVVHMVLDEFLLHATTFGLAVYLITTRTLKLIKGIPEPAIRRNFRKTAILGSYAFCFGYFVWLLDDWACRTLISTRRSIGLPLSFLLELHGWWHVFTAIGGYIAVVVTDAITADEIHHDLVESLAFPVPFAARSLMGTKKVDKKA
ncbi:ceramidase [Xylariales sp. PMI_506]|nr:ceramidase [Xylariales sp. PMI_506]